MHFAIFHSCLQVFYLKNSVFLMRQVACFHYLYNILRNISREIALSHSRSPAMVYVNLPETYAHFFVVFIAYLGSSRESSIDNMPNNKFDS